MMLSYYDVIVANNSAAEAMSKDSWSRKQTSISALITKCSGSRARFTRCCKFLICALYLCIDSTCDRWWPENDCYCTYLCALFDLNIEQQSAFTLGLASWFGYGWKMITRRHVDDKLMRVRSQKRHGPNCDTAIKTIKRHNSTIN